MLPWANVLDRRSYEPTEISNNTSTAAIYGVLSTIPFLYILYVLFVELTKSLERKRRASRNRRPSLLLLDL